jgi:vacuolar-type H+-ATPase subunit F/Vma7
MNTNIILHYSESAKYSNDAFLKTMKSIFDQTTQDFEIVIINNKESDDISKQIDAINSNSAKVTLLSVTDEAQSAQLNKALKGNKSRFQLYIDNRTQQIVLKKSALELYILAAENNKNTGMIYSDYELLEDEAIKEIHLLKHHTGRVRDNQDYCKLFFFTHEAL